MTPLTEILLKFFITFAFSLVFGLERQRAHKPIGFGTFIFVAIGSCGLSITATLLAPDNPLPLLGAIITGIGFLGGGALIKTTDRIFGFTTAASIWLFAIIGLVVGVGDYLVALLIYISIWVIILIDRYLEKKGIGSYQRKIVLVANRNISTDELESVLLTKKYKIVNVDISKKLNQFTLTVLAQGTRPNINQLPKRLFKADWIESFKVD